MLIETFIQLAAIQIPWVMLLFGYHLANVTGYWERSLALAPLPVYRAMTCSFCTAFWLSLLATIGVIPVAGFGGIAFLPLYWYLIYLGIR